MQGQLFSHDFLTRGIVETAPWQSLDPTQLNVFVAELRRVYAAVYADSALNEAQTERELIEPLLALLGWEHLPQINLSESGREDVPDFLLFADAAAKLRAMASVWSKPNAGCACWIATKPSSLPRASRATSAHRRRKCCVICRAPT